MSTSRKQQQTPPGPPPPQRTGELAVVAIEFPLGADVEGYDPDMVQCHGLTQRQAKALKATTAELRRRNERYHSRQAKTGEGLVVDKDADTIRWWLDRIADAREMRADGLEATNGEASS